MFGRTRSNRSSLSRQSEGLSARDGGRALKLLAAFEDHTSGWFWETDADGRITYLSLRIASTLQTAGIVPEGMRLSDVFHTDNETTGISRSLSFHLTAQKAFSDYPVCGAQLSKADWWSISGRPIIDEQGIFRGFVGSGADLTEARRSQAVITRLAYTDALTELANRQHMKTSLAHLLTIRTSGFKPTALLIIDLDRFKTVNDTLGHQTGDELLKQVAKRLERVVGSGGIIGRLGGDEFEIILASDTSRTDLHAIAKDTIHSVSQPYFINNAPITIGCSIGIAIAPEHGDDTETLVRNADLALYAAKDAGRGLYRVYTDDLLKDARRRKQLEDDLRSALVRDELFVVYQPVVSTKAGRIVGFEALIRWQHPERGLISPAEFIPVAEESGLIEAIGGWVMQTAASDAVNWPDDLRVAVNVSPVQFANPQLATTITRVLAATGLRPDRLELEITEGVFLDDNAHSDQMFRLIKSLGVRLALDDFGTGYSSLGYLKSAPFDKIKVDQSFVRGAIMVGTRNAAIIRAIVSLANALEMETTAEGVEQQDEIEFIRDLGCSHIQGFVYGKPLRATEVADHLESKGTDATLIGHKVSRAPRNKVFRSAKMTIGEASSEVFVRDLSAHGAMIEAGSLSQGSIGLDVLIELIDGQLWTGNIRWIRNGRAGLQFERAVDQSLLG